MAKPRRVLPARRQNAMDDSLLIRSAESLGRMIGTLQRQLDAARHLTDRTAELRARRDGHVNANHSKSGAQTRTKSAAATSRSASNRKAKRAAKSAAAKPAPARRRSASGKRSAKSGRGA